MTKLFRVIIIVISLCLISTLTFAVELAPQPKFQAYDSNGDPLSGGKLYTYITGTTTNKATYTTSAGTVANENPVILDINGQADVWLEVGQYRFKLTDSDDVDQWTVDGISGMAFLEVTSGTTGYIAVYVTESSVKAVATISGVSITDYTIMGTKISKAAVVNIDTIVSGVSQSVGLCTTGTSIVVNSLNTVVNHDSTGSSIYGLPAISGTSVIVVKFWEGAPGAGITVYTADTTNAPFMGDGLSGTSYLALPPGNQFQSATVYGFYISGTCRYWGVEAMASWVAGN